MTVFAQGNKRLLSDLSTEEMVAWNQPAALGRYSIYTWTCNANVKKSNKRFSIVMVPYRRARDVSVKRHVSLKRKHELEVTEKVIEFIRKKFPVVLTL
jgi:hypothetical protein